MNNLKPFTLIGDKDDQQHGGSEEFVLLNINQIVSIKPINIVIDAEVIKGWWIRTSNGKKYRATKIPDEIKALIQEHIPM